MSFRDPIESFEFHMSKTYGVDDILIMMRVEAFNRNASTENIKNAWRQWKSWAKKLEISVWEIDSEVLEKVIVGNSQLKHIPVGKPGVPFLVLITTDGTVKTYDEFSKGVNSAKLWTPEHLFEFVCQHSPKSQQSRRCQRQGNAWPTTTTTTPNSNSNSKPRKTASNANANANANAAKNTKKNANANANSKNVTKKNANSKKNASA
jgi:hypothetical protein